MVVFYQKISGALFNDFGDQLEGDGGLVSRVNDGEKSAPWTCFNCGEQGHKSWGCKKERRERLGRKI